MYKISTSPFPDQPPKGLVNLCHYRNIFGVSGKGIHSYRVFGIAVVDVIVTLVAAIALAYFCRLPVLWTVIVIFILGIFMHRMFYVRTTVDKLLFSGPRDDACSANTSD
jgi:fatty acid desaturase